MTKPSWPGLRIVLTGLVAASLGMACAPTAPSSGARTPSLQRLEIAGPQSVAPGDRARFSVTAIMSTGARRDVTAEAAWVSLVPAVMTVEPGGDALAHTSGETALQATFENRTATWSVLVLPHGTFRLIGSVIVSDNATFTSYPLSGGLIEVITERDEKFTTSTDGAGGYRIYGIAGPVLIRVSKSGYSTAVQTATVVANHRVDFEVYPLDGVN